MKIPGAAMIAGYALTMAAGSASAQQSDAQQSDWASCNRTLTSDRFSPPTALDKTNAATLREVCRFDTRETTAFQSGLVQVNGALFATTQRDTFSINPDTGALNWRVHEDFPEHYLGSQRGVAVAEGRVFRGLRDGRVYANDERTGARLWSTVIADRAKGETAPSAPIDWNGMVFIGIAGDNGGVKGRTYALDGATGRIIWEAYLVPKEPGDPERGPPAPFDPPVESWQNEADMDITGGGSWSSYSLDPATGLLCIPGGNPTPIFAGHLRQGENLYAGSLVVLDANTGAYHRHYSVVPRDSMQYDISSAPALFTARNGTQVLALTPKDGFIYAYDRQTGRPAALPPGRFRTVQVKPSDPAGRHALLPWRSGRFAMERPGLRFRPRCRHLRPGELVLHGAAGP